MVQSLDLKTYIQNSNNMKIKYSRLLFLFLCSTFMFLQAKGQVKSIEPVIHKVAVSDILTLKKLIINEDQLTVVLELNHYAGMEFSMPVFSLLDEDGLTHKVSASQPKLGNYSFNNMGVAEIKLRFNFTETPPDLFSLLATDHQFKDIIVLEKSDVLKQATENTLLYSILGNYHKNNYELDLAEQYLGKYAYAMEKEKKDKPERYIAAMNDLIQLFITTMNYPEAERICRNTLQEFENKTEHCTDLFASLGDILQVQAKHQEAIEAYLKYLKYKAIKKPLTGNDFSTSSNLILYSFGNLEKSFPIAIGLAVHPQKLLEGKAYLKVFHAGAKKMRISTNKDFSGKNWEDADNKYVLDISESDTKLYFQVKNNLNEMSSVYELGLDRIKKALNK